jgi:hypothetical protein
MKPSAAAGTGGLPKRGSSVDCGLSELGSAPGRACSAPQRGGAGLASLRGCLVVVLESRAQDLRGASGCASAVRRSTAQTARRAAPQTCATTRRTCNILAAAQGAAYG